MLTKEQAIALGEAKFYEKMSHREIAEFQISEPFLCMPFDVFHEALEKTLNRPVFTHEFACADDLRRELFEGKAPPTPEEIINMIPVEKRIVIKL